MTRHHCSHILLSAFLFLGGAFVGCGRSPVEEGSVEPVPQGEGTTAADASLSVANSGLPKAGTAAAIALAPIPDRLIHSPNLSARASAVTPLGAGHYNGTREVAVQHSPSVRLLRMSPTGQFVLSARQVSQNGTLLQVWDIPSAKLILEWYEPLGATAAAFSPDEHNLAYGAGDRCVVLQPLPAGSAARWKGHRLAIGDLIFSPDGKLLATHGHDNRLLIWETARAAVMTETFTGGEAFAAQVRFSRPDRLWTRSSDNLLRWYDFKDRALTLNREIKLPDGFQALAADGEQLYGLQSDENVHIIDAATGKESPAGSRAPEKATMHSAAPPGSFRPVPLMAVAEATQELAVCDWDGLLAIVSTRNPASRKSWNIGVSGVQALAMDREALHFAIRTAGGGLCIFDREKPEVLRFLEPEETPGPIVAPCFSPDGESLVTLRDAATIAVAEIKTGLMRQRFAIPRSSDPAKAETVTSLAAGRHHIAYCGTSAGTVELLKTESQPSAVTIPVSQVAVTALAESPDGQYLLAGDQEGTTIWIDPGQTFAPDPRHGIHQSRIRSAAFSSDGRWAATGSDDHSVALWEVARRAKPLLLQGHLHAVRALVFSPDSQWLISGDQQGLVILWEVASGRQVWSARVREALLRPHDEPAPATQSPGGAAADQGITSLAFSPDQHVLAVGTGAGYMQTFDLVHSRELSPAFQRAPVAGLAFAADGASLLVATSLGDVLRWWRGPGPALVFPGHEGQVRFAALDAAGRRAVTGGHDKHLCIWDVDQKSLLKSLDNDGEAITCGALSPDGLRAVTAGFGSGIVFWDLTEMKRLIKRYGHGKRVWSLAFSPDGMTVASGCDDQTVKIWDFASQKVRQTIALDAFVRFVTFSPDGTKLLTSTFDPRGWKFPARLQLWDRATGRPLREFSGHLVNVTSAVFSRDGSTVISCGADGQVCRWDVTTGKRLSETFRTHGLSHASLLQQGRQLVLLRYSDGVYLDQAGSLARLSEFDVPTRAIGDLSAAADADRIIAGTVEGSVYVWSVTHE